MALGKSRRPIRRERIRAAPLAEGRGAWMRRVNKRSLHVVNEHFEPTFDAAMARACPASTASALGTQLVFQQPAIQPTRENPAAVSPDGSESGRRPHR